MSYRDDMAAPYRWAKGLALGWIRRPAKSRVDRSRMYVWIHVGLIVNGAGLWWHPYGVGALAYFNHDTNRALAMCIMSGSVICVLGSLMGNRFWFPSAATDVRLPYMFAVGGQLSVLFSLVLYEIELASHNDISGNFSGSLLVAIIAGCAQTALVCMKEIRRINRLDRIVRNGGVSADRRKRRSRYEDVT